MLITEQAIVELIVEDLQDVINCVKLLTWEGHAF